MSPLAIYTVTDNLNIPFPQGSFLLWSSQHEVAIQLNLDYGISGEVAQVALAHSKRVTSKTITACCSYVRKISDPTLFTRVSEIARNILAIETLEAQSLGQIPVFNLNRR